MQLTLEPGLEMSSVGRTGRRPHRSRSTCRSPTCPSGSTASNADSYRDREPELTTAKVSREREGKGSRTDASEAAKLIVGQKATADSRAPVNPSNTSGHEPNQLLLRMMI
jgi:hypothetical protein